MPELKRCMLQCAQMMQLCSYHSCVVNINPKSDVVQWQFCLHHGAHGVQYHGGIVVDVAQESQGQSDDVQ